MSTYTLTALVTTSWLIVSFGASGGTVPFREEIVGSFSLQPWEIHAPREPAPWYAGAPYKAHRDFPPGRRKVFPQPVSKAAQPVDTAGGGCRDPGLQVMAPPLSGFP